MSGGRGSPGGDLPTEATAAVDLVIAERGWGQGGWLGRLRNDGPREDSATGSSGTEQQV